MTINAKLTQRCENVHRSRRNDDGEKTVLESKKEPRLADERTNDLSTEEEIEEHEAPAIPE